MSDTNKQIDYEKRIWELMILFCIFSFITSIIPIYFNQIRRYPDGNTFVQQKYKETFDYDTYLTQDPNLVIQSHFNKLQVPA